MDAYQEGGCAVVKDDGGEGPFEGDPGPAAPGSSRPVALVLEDVLGGLDENGRAEEEKAVSREQAMPHAADDLGHIDGGIALGQPFVHICPTAQTI